MESDPTPKESKLTSLFPEGEQGVKQAVANTGMERNIRYDKMLTLQEVPGYVYNPP